MNDEIKEMKIGMYTTDEILEHLTEGEGRGFLGRSMYDAITDYITNLQGENERLKETNVYCNRTDCSGRLKDSRKYDSVYQEKEDYKSKVEKAVEYINNFSVDKSFSFPLMKRWEEKQVKSSIDYEFNDTLKKDLLNILQNGSDDNEKD